MDSSSGSEVLVIGFDIGTALSAVAYTLAPSLHYQAYQSVSGEEVINNLFTNLFTVPFTNGPQVSSQLAWYHRKSRWVWGVNVDLLVETGEIEEADRIEMIKLCIETSPRTYNIREKVRRQLNRLPALACKDFGHPSPPTFEDLIRLYLKFIWQRAAEKIMECYSHRSDNISQDSQIHCWISVPKLWSTQMNDAVITAAVLAGIPNADLVHEPEAAAAFCLLENQMMRNRSIGSRNVSLAVSLVV